MVQGVLARDLLLMLSLLFGNTTLMQMAVNVTLDHPDDSRTGFLAVVIRSLMICLLFVR